MRRGLISHSKIELPDAVLDARLDRVRAAMAEARLDALIVYSNNTRPAGVSWLTGFVPYWSEALLVVPRDGAPYLVVALTFRVKSWIERTSRVADVIHTPRIGLGAAQKIAAGKSDAAVGIVDLDGLSAGIVDDLREGGPRLALSDASALFARLRAKADPAEIALAVKAASIAHAALAGARGRQHRHDDRRRRSEGAKSRRRGDLPGGGPRPCARPSACAHRGRSRARRKLRIARDRRLQGSLGAADEEFLRHRTRACRDGAFRTGGCAVAERARICRLYILAGRGLPNGAAARSADGIARRLPRVRRVRERWFRCRPTWRSTAARCWSALPPCWASAARRQACWSRRRSNNRSLDSATPPRRIGDAVRAAAGFRWRGACPRRRWCARGPGGAP